jgi:hypothetical protein
MSIFSRIKQAIKAIPKKIKSFFIKTEQKIDEFLFGKPKPQPKKEEEIKVKPKEEEKKKPEETKPVTLTVSTELYVGNKTEKFDIVRQFPSREDALANVERLAREAIDQNLHRASEIAKSVSYRIDDAPVSLVAGRVKSDKKTRVKHNKKK